MDDVSARCAYFSEDKTLIERLLAGKPTEADGMLEKRLKEAELEEERRLSRLAADLGCDKAGNPMLRLSALIDGGEGGAKEAYAAHLMDAFGSLGFLAAEVARTIRGRDMAQARQLAWLLAEDNGVLEDRLWALIPYLNVLDKEYAEHSADRLDRLLVEGLADPAKVQARMAALEAEAVESLGTKNQHGLCRILALKELIRLPQP
jgi:hypothetical protein